MRDYTEDAAIERPALNLLARAGYEPLRAYQEQLEHCPVTGRTSQREVVLRPRLLQALQRLNPQLPSSALEAALEKLTADRSSLGLVRANQAIYQLLKDGVTVQVPADEQTGAPAREELVRVIAWEPEQLAQNDFCVVSQFWVKGEVYRRRADLVLFVNGLPLVLFELKAQHRRLSRAYEENLSDYKETIPQLFAYNALIVLSNGRESKFGSLTADWEHFFPWKKINSEGEVGVVSLDTMIQGLCAPARLLDMVENFTLFAEVRGGLVKILAQNHQYLGVNQTFAAVGERQQNQGRLGVFWHTQGSGKSYSMLFLAQKVRRKLPGNWTFLIVTDREDLDDQIYQTFADTGVVQEDKKFIRPANGAELQQLLREDHTYIFTLIQKFRSEFQELPADPAHPERGALKIRLPYPQLSTRSDVIVMSDEAHRTQYAMLAQNLHIALPNAAYLGFTGTPLLAGEEKTRAIFGDYVSVYNFGESITNGTTVPLFYENRTPELELTNAGLNEQMEQLLDKGELSDEQEDVLAREFSREYSLITRDERLNTLARDIVRHFIGRGYLGKAMVVSIDKVTAVRMHDKVWRYWQEELAELRARYAACPLSEPEQRAQLAAQISFMEETRMAVIVSQSQNELAKCKKFGLDAAMLEHRKRIESGKLEEQFKTSDHPLRLVFVCAMWITGFDVPSLSTVYLDKPMCNHTLMQTIARANRVFHHKLNGLIVDYIGIFRNLQRALALYAASVDGSLPIRSKDALIAELQEALAKLAAFCQEHAIDLNDILATPLDNFLRQNKIYDAEDRLKVNDEVRNQYVTLATATAKLYKAILPDPAASTYSALVALASELLRLMYEEADPADFSASIDALSALLDASIGTKRYVIREVPGVEGGQELLDLSKIDFAALRAQFAEARKNTEFQRLRGQVSAKLRQMIRLNKHRVNYQERLQQLINDYNQGSANIDTSYFDLLDFMQDLQQEEQRTTRERLSEEELAMFDSLLQSDLQLSSTEREEVKQVVRDLLRTLKKDKLVLDWRKKSQATGAVQSTIQDVLDRLPSSYTRELYTLKCRAVYEHVHSSYYGEGRSLYADAS